MSSFYDNEDIECDGDYWHGSIEVRISDRVRDERLKEFGYRVIRFWEHEINDNVKRCVRKIKRIIKSYDEETNGMLKMFA